jgi:hypothetical protein
LVSEDHHPTAPLSSVAIPCAFCIISIRVSWQLRCKSGTFLAQSDTIPSWWQTDHFLAYRDDKTGIFAFRRKCIVRNEAASEACSPDATNGYGSENDVFSFCMASQSSRKTAKSHLENGSCAKKGRFKEI